VIVVAPHEKAMNIADSRLTSKKNDV